MNADMVTFDNGEFRLDVTPHDVDGFRVAGPGLARALGFNSASVMVRNLPDAEKGSVLKSTPGGPQAVIYVTEAGFYRIVGQRQAARIKVPAVRAQVERFQTWTFGVVIPGIRRTGTYSAPSAPSVNVAALDRRALALLVIEAEDAREAAESRVAVLEPLAATAEALISTKGDYSVREAAGMLARDAGIATGQGRLFTYLREIGWIDPRGRIYARHEDAGRITTRPVVYNHPHTGEPVLADPQVRITPKGLAELHKLMTAPNVPAPRRSR